MAKNEEEKNGKSVCFTFEIEIKLARICITDKYKYLCVLYKLSTLWRGHCQFNQLVDSIMRRFIYTCLCMWVFGHGNTSFHTHTNTIGLMYWDDRAWNRRFCLLQSQRRSSNTNAMRRKRSTTRALLQSTKIREHLTIRSTIVEHIQANLLFLSSGRRESEREEGREKERGKWKRFEVKVKVNRIYPTDT